MSILDPLSRAIFGGDLKSIDALLAGRDVNLRTKGGDEWNLLHLACDSRRAGAGVVQRLIELGVDVNARDRRRWTPLHFAARTKNPAAVKLLIDAGAEIDAENDEEITPLHESIVEFPSNLEVVELFLAAGAKTDAVRKYVNAIASSDKGALLDLLAKYDTADAG